MRDGSGGIPVRVVLIVFVACESWDRVALRYGLLTSERCSVRSEIYLIIPVPHVDDGLKLLVACRS